MPKISIVVPLFNEEESLPLLIKAITDVMQRENYSFEVLFVDDGSTDKSFSVLKEIRSTHGNHIKVYRFSRNYGKSAALSIGIKHATGDIIVTMDADLQDDPEAIPEMIRTLDQGWDVVSGWKKKRYDPLSKTLPSKVWNTGISMLCGLKLHDFNCGFKAYRKETAKSLEIYGDRHRYLPALAHWNGYRVTEMVVPHHARKFGKSKYGVWRMVNGFLDMLTLLFLKRYLKSPLHFFGVLGFLMIFIGTSILGYFGVEWIITQQMHIRPLTILSIGALIVGIQFLSFGFLAEMLTNMAPRDSYTIRESIE
jgi:glycosyltransferase involved in cell wall biosynthesis